ncbi:MAG: UpxY family transcription antiterminator [Bacteroidota bacterium]
MRNWYVIYTLSRHEKKIESYLKGKGFEVFLPMRKQLRQWSDRKKLIDIPLFPNYLFVETDPTRFWEVTSVPGVIKFVSIRKKPVPVSECIVNSIRQVMHRTSEVDNINLQAGERVKLIQGPFAGLEGIYLRQANKQMLVIEIEILKRSIMFEVNPNHIQSINQYSNAGQK